MKPKPNATARASLVWPRADDKALAAFDAASKYCTMNCGPHRDDPRSKAERKLLCDECVPASKTA